MTSNKRARCIERSERDTEKDRCNYCNYQLQNWIAKCNHRSPVHLSQIALNDRDIHIVITEAMINKQCTVLELRQSGITTNGIALLAEALRSNTTLLTLDLRANDIPDEGILFLMDALLKDNITLISLNLADNAITDQGAEYVAKMLQMNDKLTHLWLDMNRIGNQGIEALADALAYQNQNLEQLCLNGNILINDSCLNSLLDILKHNQSINRLEISGCHLSENSKIRLKNVTKPEEFKLEV